MNNAEKREFQIGAMVSREVADVLEGRGSPIMESIAGSLRKGAEMLEAEVGVLPVLAPPTKEEHDRAFRSVMAACTSALEAYASKLAGVRQ